jgi:DNA-binding response OmpR family regulator
VNHKEQPKIDSAMKKKVIIADDNEIIRMLLDEYLKNDFDVKTCADGREVLTELSNGNIPDLIVADVEMPNLNGWSLINNLKISVFFKNIPILILSGKDKTQEKIKFLQAGAEDYMVKPFSPEELKVKIQNIIKRISYGNTYY